MAHEIPRQGMGYKLSLPIWFKQDKYYVEIWTEKDTMVGLLEQLVANEFDGVENAIPVNSLSGNDSRSHALIQTKRLREHEARGRKIIIIYLGDYDPSGLLAIQNKAEARLIEEGITNYEVRRVGITMEQIRRLRLKEVTDPDKLKKLANDPNGPAFERVPENGGRRFAVEVDAMSSGSGLKELKHVIRNIKKEFWDEKTWNKYKDEFTPEKVKMCLIAEFVPYAREIVDMSSNPEQTIEEFAASLKDETDELLGLAKMRASNWETALPVDDWDDFEEDD